MDFDLSCKIVRENREYFKFAQTSAYSSVVLEVKEECIGREQ